MKIAYITDQILPRTATDTRQMVSMASAMGEAGASVTLVTPRRWLSPEPVRDEIAAFYEVEPSFSVESVRSVYPNIRGIEKLAQGIAGPLSNAAKDADVVYTRTLPIVTGALLFGNRPVVYETYRPWPLQRPASMPLLQRMGHHPRFLGAVLHSDFARDAYAKAGVPGEKLLTAYNGYRPDHFQPALTREDARVHCRLPRSGRIVAYAGTVERKKGIDMLLRFARDLPDVTFVLVGSRPGNLESEVRLLSNVVTVPWQPESRLAPYLFAADVLIIPPTSAPLVEVGNTVLPIKTFQYLAAGRPILAPATPDISEILVDGVNACLVEPDEPARTVERLRTLLDNVESMNDLAEAALRTSTRFTWESRAERVLRFISARLDVMDASD